MSEGLKREIETATRDELLAISDLTKRRCMTLADHDLRESLHTLDCLKPFKDIISTVVVHRPSWCIVVTFHGVKYHVHFHARAPYSKTEAFVSCTKCTDSCVSNNQHDDAFGTIATNSDIKINKRDFPTPQHLAEFIAFMDAMNDPRIALSVELSMKSRSE